MHKVACIIAFGLLWAALPVAAQPSEASRTASEAPSGAPKVTTTSTTPEHAAQAPSASSPGQVVSREGVSSTELEKKPEIPKEGLLAPKKVGAYEMMIRDLNEKVSDLKEKIFRSKARLILLKETVLHGAISGSKAVLFHRNEMGSSFRLEQVMYSLDGAPIYQKTDHDGDLDERDEFEIFHGAIVPGNHNLSVYFVYRGYGHGIFSYLEGYVFKLRSSFAFTAEEGKVIRIKVVGYEKGGITTDLKERPSVRFDMEILKDEPEPVRADTQARKTEAPKPGKARE